MDKQPVFETLNNAFSKHLTTRTTWVQVLFYASIESLCFKSLRVVLLFQIFAHIHSDMQIYFRSNNFPFFACFFFLLQLHQTQRQEGLPHLHRVPGVPSGALPRPDGERACAEGRLRLPPGLRAVPGALQDALQADLAALARTRQVTAQLSPREAANCEGSGVE